MFNKLQNLDQQIYQIEVYIVALALTCMSMTVGLDIVYRMLTQTLTHPWIDLMTVFGVWQKFPASPIWNWTAPLVVLILSMVITYKRSNQKSTSRWKQVCIIFVTCYASAVALYQLPSYIVCISIILSIAYLMNKDKMRHYPMILALCFCAWHAPQNYIWSKEFALILMPWLCFLGASMACYQHKHIQVNGLITIFPKTWHQAIKKLSWFLTACFTAYLALLFIIDIWGHRGSWYSHAHRPNTKIPEWFISLSGVWAFIMMSVRCCLYACQPSGHQHTESEQIADKQPKQVGDT